MRKTYYILPLLAAAVFSSCEKDIDFDYHELDPITVIEANLSDTHTSVIITETTPVDEPMNRTRYTDATVLLTDLTTSESTLLTPDTEDTYTFPGAGIPGHSYKLTVDRSGKHYEATSAMLMPAKLLSFHFYRVAMPMEMSMIVSQVIFIDPPDTRGDCFIVRFFRNGELLSMGTISDIQATTQGLLIASTMMPDRYSMPEGYDIDDESLKKLLRDGDEITVSVTPVERGYYDYLVALKSGSNGPRMFDGDFCLGYFLAAPESEATLIYDHTTVPEYETPNININ